MNEDQKSGQKIIAYILKSLGFSVKTLPALQADWGIIITVDPCLEPVKITSSTHRILN